jgi:hypothetical protein
LLSLLITGYLLVLSTDAGQFFGRMAGFGPVGIHGTGLAFGPEKSSPSGTTNGLGSVDIGFNGPASFFGPSEDAAGALDAGALAPSEKRIAET